MFLIFGDSISYVPFSIWRLPWLLRFCKTKFDQSSRCPKKKKITCPTNSYTKITCPKNSHTKICPKNSHTKNHIVHRCPKNPHDQNHNQKFSMIKITIENFPCLKSQSQKFPWSYVTHLTKIFHSPKSHTHKIFPYP